MTKAKFLAILAIMVLILTLPSVASAQRLPPHVFVGTASIDDAAAPEGTSVTAWVSGAQVASTTTTGAAGDYVITVDQGDSSFSGETISFQVGGVDAAQTGVWTQGGADLLNLSVSTSTVETPTPEATAEPEVVAVPGERGPRGRTGFTGRTGSEGPAGPRGARGEIGGAGSAGSSGATGSRGAAGPAGAQGATGDAGSLGLSGAVGEDGDSSVLGIVALILGIIAIVGAGGAFMGSRRS